MDVNRNRIGYHALLALVFLAGAAAGSFITQNKADEKAAIRLANSKALVNVLIDRIDASRVESRVVEEVLHQGLLPCLTQDLKGRLLEAHSNVYVAEHRLAGLVQLPAPRSDK